MGFRRPDRRPGSNRGRWRAVPGYTTPKSGYTSRRDQRGNRSATGSATRRGSRSRQCMPSSPSRLTTPRTPVVNRGRSPRADRRGRAARAGARIGRRPCRTAPAGPRDPWGGREARVGRLPSWRSRALLRSAGRRPACGTRQRKAGENGGKFGRCVTVLSVVIVLLPASEAKCGKGGSGCRFAQSGLRVKTPHATPRSGYTSRRDQRGSRSATGSAKVSATASHWSGLAAPRRRMSSFFSSRRRVLLS